MYEFHPFRLDAVNQCLWSQVLAGEDERIQLTPKAFAILQHLVNNANRLVPHRELIDVAWPDTFVQPEVLSSHIRDLRAALGDNAREPRFIETLARRGYRFIAKVIESVPRASDNPPDFAPRKLVGRELPLAKLNERFKAMLGGRRQLVFITGEPGIGKTALCLQFLHQIQASAQPYHIGWGQCIEGYGGQEPYFPMLRAIGELCRTGGDSVLRTLTLKAPTCVVQFPGLLKPEHREMLERAVIGATAGRMLREVLEALEAIALDRPLILFLEDLQWVDHATVDVISEFARRRESARILLIATFRPLDVLLNESPIKLQKSELLAHRLCREISLEPLSESDIAEYLFDLSAEPDLRTDLANLLYRRSEGNPLFMVAAVEHSLEQGLMFQKDGRLHLRDPLTEMDLEMPQGLRQMVEAQIDRLSEEEQWVLDTASVAGVTFSSDVVTSATDYDFQRVEGICHNLARGNHVVRPAGFQEFPNQSRSSRYEFIHVLYREVLYDRQAPGRRSTRHLLIGNRVERLYGNDLEEVAAELAYHFEHASDWIRTVKYLRLAAETAEQRYAHRVTIALLLRAVDLLSRLPEEERPGTEMQILRRLATIYAAVFDPRCTEVCERLAKKASDYGLIEIEIQALIDLASSLSWVSAERCLETVEHALPLAASLGDSITQARVRMTWHFWRLWAGEWNKEDLDAMRSELWTIRQSGDRHLLAPHLVNYGRIQWASSEYREAHTYLTEGMEILTEAAGEQNPYLSPAYQHTQFYLPFCLLSLGEWGEALREVNISIATADRNGDYFRAQLLRLNRAWIHLHAMDFAGVLTACEATPKGTGNLGVGSVYLFRFSRVLAGLAEVALGNYDQAFKELLTLRKDMDRKAFMLDWYFRMPLESALTELWLANGSLTKAREGANLFLGKAMSTMERTWQALAWELNARVAMAERNLGGAQEAILKALSVIEGRETPLAAWRVHASAAHFYEFSENPKLRQHHREIARTIVLKLANSFGAEHSLRTSFLSSPSASGLLEEKDTIYTG